MRSRAFPLSTFAPVLATAVAALAALVLTACVANPPRDEAGARPAAGAGVTREPAAAGVVETPADEAGDVAPDAYLLMANPAEDMSTGITIGWHTEAEGTFVEIAPAGETALDEAIEGGALDGAREGRARRGGGEVPLGASAFANARRVLGECEPISHHDTATDITYEELKCIARVTGLEPGTDYVYRAGREAFSPVNRFRTAAPGEPFSFVYMSDVHVHNPIPRRLETGDSLLAVARSLTDDVGFTLFAGDMLAYGSAYDAWESLSLSDLVRTQVTAFSPGNHEFYDHRARSRGPGYFNTFVYNPDNGAEGVKNTSYFFRYGNLLVLSISSEDSWADEAHLESQQRWLRDVVANNPAEFIVAFNHRPFYNGSTGNAGHAQTNRTHWSPIFDEVGLDLMLAGHDHVYVRTARTYRGEVSDDPRVGTVYMGTTAVGDRWNDVDPDNPYTNIEAILGGHGLSLATVLTVGPSEIRIRTFDLDGEIVDEAVVAAVELAGVEP